MKIGADAVTLKEGGVRLRTTLELVVGHWQNVHVSAEESVIGQRAIHSGSSDRSAVIKLEPSDSREVTPMQRGRTV